MIFGYGLVPWLPSCRIALFEVTMEPLHPSSGYNFEKTKGKITIQKIEV
jgi:hypothetical protein